MDDVEVSRSGVPLSLLLDKSVNELQTSDEYVDDVEVSHPFCSGVPSWSPTSCVHMRLDVEGSSISESNRHCKAVIMALCPRAVEC